MMMYMTDAISHRGGNIQCNYPRSGDQINAVCPKRNVTFKFFLKEKRRRARAGRMMDVSLGLFDELIESCAPSAARLSAANDGLLSMNGTNAPAAHLTGKSVFQSSKGNFFQAANAVHIILSCASFP